MACILRASSPIITLSITIEPLETKNTGAQSSLGDHWLVKRAAKNVKRYFRAKTLYCYLRTANFYVYFKQIM